MEGGCQVPMGARANIKGERIEMVGFISDINGKRVLRLNKNGSRNSAEAIGKNLAEELLDMGGREILKDIYGM